LKSYAFLFWAYMLIWAGLAGYLLFLLSRLRSVDRRLERVERELDRRAGSPPPAG
jgi:CcmD family protein